MESPAHGMGGAAFVALLVGDCVGGVGATGEILDIAVRTLPDGTRAGVWIGQGSQPTQGGAESPVTTAPPVPAADLEQAGLQIRSDILADSSDRDGCRYCTLW
jgi:hypothetical protein